MNGNRRFVLAAAAALGALLLWGCQPKIRDGREAPARQWFSHEKHVTGQGLECGACHEGAAQSEQAADNNLPRVRACLNCHEKGQEACRVCDRDPVLPVDGEHRGRNLRFPHRTHVAADVACATCHAGIESATEATLERFIPAMETCFSCHAEKPCSLCHVDMQARGFAPKSHDAFWREKHSLSAKSDLATCDDCHRSGWCQECHQGDVETRYHDPTFRNTHGLEARLRPGGCDRCHLTNFCESCHRSLKRD